MLHDWTSTDTKSGSNDRKLLWHVLSLFARLQCISHFFLVIKVILFRQKRWNNGSATSLHRVLYFSYHRCQFKILIEWLSIISLICIMCYGDERVCSCVRSTLKTHTIKLHGNAAAGVRHYHPNDNNAPSLFLTQR